MVRGFLHLIILNVGGSLCIKMLELKDKKILLTGGSGFLGSYVLSELQKQGISDSQIIIPRLPGDDLRDIKNCRRLVQGCQVVLHLAGITGDAQFHETKAAEIFYDNLIMGIQLMEASRELGVEKFVAIGSATEYPENAPLPFREENLWMGRVGKLHEAYTVAKKMILVQGQAYQAQYHFPAVHLLMTNLYGPGKEAAGGFVITNIIRRVLEAQATAKEEIEVWGTGQPTRDFLYGTDAARGIILAAEKYEGVEPINLGSGWEISIKELVEMICRLMDFKGKIIWNTEKPDGVLRRMLDTSHAEKAFGFRALTSFEDGLRATIDWHRAQKTAE